MEAHISNNLKLLIHRRGEKGLEAVHPEDALVGFATLERWPRGGFVDRRHIIVPIPLHQVSDVTEHSAARISK